MEYSVTTGIHLSAGDGTILATDLYLPAEVERHPAVLLRTPYSKEAAIALPDLVRFLAAGYAVVTQDTRGRFGSEASFVPFANEADDGAATIAWIAAQPWSDGSVAMAGPSYVGATQWLAASRRPPALRAIAPQTTASSYYEGWCYQGGALQLGFLLWWTLAYLAPPEAARRAAAGSLDQSVVAALLDARDDVALAYRRLPLHDLPFEGSLAPYYLEWLAHPFNDDHWRSTAPEERYEDVMVPSLNIGGWFDCFLAGTLNNYRGMATRGGSVRARRPRLVVGPWSHGQYFGDFPERSFGARGAAAACDVVGEQIRFFDEHVRGGSPDAGPPVRIFVMGADAWRDEDDWPLPGTRFTEYNLRSNGGANTAAGDGRLTLEPPEDEPADTFLYDPAEPVPTVGGQTFLPGLMVSSNAGPRDQRTVEARSDVLCYTSEPLEQDLEVTGPVVLVLYVSSSAPDTDFTGKLVDVHPDGRAEGLTDGILRMRAHHVGGAAGLLPGDVERITIDLVATSNVFKSGHRIRVEVSSSNFPRFDRNLNGGTDEHTTACNVVHHDRARPSHVVLSIVGERWC